MSDNIAEFAAAFNEEALFADGLDEAFIGMAERAGQNTIACYDTQKVIDTLVERDGMTREEALEYFQFNIVGAYVGENTPVFIFLKE